MRKLLLAVVFCFVAMPASANILVLQNTNVYHLYNENTYQFAFCTVSFSNGIFFNFVLPPKAMSDAFPTYYSTWQCRY